MQLHAGLAFAFLVIKSNKEKDPAVLMTRVSIDAIVKYC